VAGYRLQPECPGSSPGRARTLNSPYHQYELIVTLCIQQICKNSAGNYVDSVIIKHCNELVVRSTNSTGRSIR
jgi:hypothetical protein